MIDNDEIYLNELKSFSPFFLYAPQIICFKFMYESDGCDVVGYMTRPKNIDGKLPVIIYNRGGNRDFGKLTKSQIGIQLSSLAAKNYVVLASQYRGVDGGTGRDEFGGDDLNDVKKLIDIAKNIPYVDKENIFMYGFSRGGMMTYMAARDRAEDINAAVIQSGTADVIQTYKQREQAMKRMLNNLIGGTPYNNPEEYKNRSAVNWADEIVVPLLILHAENDDRVDITQAERMINELDEANKEYDYYIYDRGGHDLGLYWFNVRKRTIDWFENYKR